MRITLAYVTYQDIRGIQSFDEETVIAVKAPPETRLEVPDPSEVGHIGFFEGRSVLFSIPATPFC